MSFTVLSARVANVATQLDRVTASANEATQAVDRIQKQTAGQKRSADAGSELLATSSFAYVFDAWIQMASINPNDPDLAKLEQFLRTWTTQAGKIDFMTLKRAFRDKRKKLGLRSGEGLTRQQAAQTAQLDEYGGR